MQRSSTAGLAVGRADQDVLHSRTPGPAARVTTDEVLVVDDDATVLTVLSSTLANVGYQCRTASNPEDALNQVLTYPSIAVILSDIYMPGMTGLEFIDRLAAQPLTRPCPRVLLLTAQPSLQCAVDALRLGACDLLTKPVRAHDLIAAVERAMQQAEADRRDYESPIAKVERLIKQSLGITEHLRHLAKSPDAISAARALLEGANPALHERPKASPSAVLDTIEVLRELRARYAQHKLDDIAWDLLLDLERAERQQRQMPVSGLMVTSATVSATTLLRRVNDLVERGYAMRVPDPKDARRDFVALAPKGRELVADFLEKAHSSIYNELPGCRNR